MTSELGEQYRTDENLRRRQGLLQFAVAPPHPQPELASTFTWDPKATVVDVGCGNGLWAQRVIETTPEATVIGVDASPGMARIFRDRVGASALVGDITRLPLQDGSADAVLALWMLYHVPDKRTALGEVARVLRPEGFLVAATNSSSDGFLGDLYRGALERVLGRPVSSWGPELDFTIENGAEILSSQFAVVDSWVTESWFEVDRPDPFIAMAESMRDVISIVNPGLAFDEFLTAIRDVAEAELRDGPIRFSRRSGFFRASGID